MLTIDLEVDGDCKYGELLAFDFLSELPVKDFVNEFNFELDHKVPF